MSMLGVKWMVCHWTLYSVINRIVTLVMNRCFYILDKNSIKKNNRSHIFRYIENIRFPVD